MTKKELTSFIFSKLRLYAQYILVDNLRINSSYLVVILKVVSEGFGKV